MLVARPGFVQTIFMETESQVVGKGMSILDSFPFCSAGESRFRLERMLREGGMAVWSDGKHTRVLSHLPAIHRPIKMLPWPLSMMQAYIIEFRIYNGDPKGDFAVSGSEPIHEHHYKKSEMNAAIDEFLRGSQPEQVVWIIRD